MRVISRISAACAAAAIMVPLGAGTALALPADDENVTPPASSSVVSNRPQNDPPSADPDPSRLTSADPTTVTTSGDPTPEPEPTDPGTPSQTPSSSPADRTDPDRKSVV